MLSYHGLAHLRSHTWPEVFLVSLHPANIEDSPSGQCPLRRAGIARHPGPAHVCCPPGMPGGPVPPLARCSTPVYERRRLLLGNAVQSFNPTYAGRRLPGFRRSPGIGLYRPPPNPFPPGEIHGLSPSRGQPAAWNAVPPQGSSGPISGYPTGTNASAQRTGTGKSANAEDLRS